MQYSRIRDTVHRNELAVGNLVDFTDQTSIDVTHNWGYYPDVTLIDGDGYVIDGEVQHTSVNAFTVTFVEETTGKIFYK